MDYSKSKQLQIFNSLFKGRSDVFAIRWEKGNKSGYSPAYHFDPYMYRAHKMKGGSFQNYADKSYLKLTDNEIIKHLNGEQFIGLYPLLPDNTSWFLVADFDKDNWVEESIKFISACNEYGIPAYLERSRSGNGGHVWIFFEKNYPAMRCRKIFISILENAGLFSKFDKGSSFDRVFPNQDSLSGKGFGNLIALPLFKKTYELGNSCFVNPDTLMPYLNQWEFLETIKRISIEHLNMLYQDCSNGNIINEPESNFDKLTITLDNVVSISRSGLNLVLVNYLKEELNFANSEYIIKKKIGKGTYGTERFFKSIDESVGMVIIPRGFIGKLIRFCRENKIEHNFIDSRKKLKEVLFNFNSTLREYQKQTILSIQSKDFGIIVAPPGSGKTIIALKTISDKRQPALIIVHRTQLLDQWVERIETFLGIPKKEIGRIGIGKNKIGGRITVATIQSLAKAIEKPNGDDIINSFGTIIIDECHHIPAVTYRNVIAKLKTFYLYGLTATPFRKYNDGRLIFSNLGEIIAEIQPAQISVSKQANIVIRNTELNVPFNAKTDKFETVSNILVHDSARNKQILDDVNIELNVSKKVVIITERKEHIDSLNQYLKQSYETITLSGDDTDTGRKSKWKLLKDGNYQVLITTGQFFGEGSDLQNANCLFLVYPFSFEGKLIQYIGRVQRSEITPTIYDYRDNKISYLDKLFLKRNAYYRKIQRQATLFDDISDESPPKTKFMSIEKSILVSFDKLDFLYGSISFKYLVEELQQMIEFDIENLDIRPEFEVLKPYIAKSLNMRNVKIEIIAEFENGKLISQLATSLDIGRIGREIIEGVKFKFLSGVTFANSLDKRKEGLLTFDQVGQNGGSLFSDEQEFLESILNSTKYIHDKQLRFLSSLHEGKTLKIRFVLKPFAFVFLVSGKNHYHIILETLDTEEATYIWHSQKTKESLINSISEIDTNIRMISLKGRQTFLDTQPKNFSRIHHDYSEGRKGFVIWRDQLEAILG
jgi:superfamily II DNA or RNA helicase